MTAPTTSDGALWLQAVWDSLPTLPAITFSESEAAAILAAIESAEDAADRAVPFTLLQALEPVRKLLDASDGPWKVMTLPWKVIPSDGKPIIASNRHGNLFCGYIATWAEADLIVAVANAMPAILAALNCRADHDRRIYAQGRRDACKNHDIASDSYAGDAGEAEPCTFADCPPGLFRWNGLLCFKSEYSTKAGQPDAYCVDSGEYFWGGTSGDLEKRRNLIVKPVASTALSHGEGRT